MDSICSGVKTGGGGTGPSVETEAETGTADSFATREFDRVFLILGSSDLADAVSTFAAP